jgi:hypothetical protein
MKNPVIYHCHSSFKCPSDPVQLLTLWSIFGDIWYPSLLFLPQQIISLGSEFRLFKCIPKTIMPRIQGLNFDFYRTCFLQTTHPGLSFGIALVRGSIRRNLFGIMVSEISLCLFGRLIEYTPFPNNVCHAPTTNRLKGGSSMIFIAEQRNNNNKHQI